MLAVCRLRSSNGGQSQGETAVFKNTMHMGTTDSHLRSQCLSNSIYNTKIRAELNVHIKQQIDGLLNTEQTQLSWKGRALRAGNKHKTLMKRQECCIMWEARFKHDSSVCGKTVSVGVLGYRYIVYQTYKGFKPTERAGSVQ